jgi:hypothetical protein
MLELCEKEGNRNINETYVCAFCIAVKHFRIYIFLIPLKMDNIKFHIIVIKYIDVNKNK